MIGKHLSSTRLILLLIGLVVVSFGVSVLMQSSQSGEGNDATANIYGVRMEYLSEQNAESGYFAIQDGQITYHTTAEKSLPPQCALHAADISRAVVLPDIDYRYLIADRTLFWECDVVGPIDAKNLQVLDLGVLSDGSSVIYYGALQSNIQDPARFRQLAVNARATDFFADSQAVYYWQRNEPFPFRVISGADPETFEAVGSNGFYAKDANHAYYKNVVLPTKESSELEVIADGMYAIDENSVYVDGEAITTGINKADLEIHLAQGGCDHMIGGAMVCTIYIKDNSTNEWQLYVHEPSVSISRVPTPSADKLSVQLFPQQ